MNAPAARRHRIDTKSGRCLGCGLAAGEASQTPICPAFYRDLAGLLIVITPDEQLVLIEPGGRGLGLDQGEMFAARDAIDEGVAELRQGGRSTVWKE